MARSINFEDLSPNDLEYLAQRPNLVSESERMGVEGVRELVKTRHDLVVDAEEEEEEEEDTKTSESDSSEEEEADDEEEVDLDELSVAKLRKLLKDREMDTTGNKSVLISRLMDSNTAE